VVSTDSAERRCSARYTLAGIAIATMTSLRERPTTDSGSDMATLVKRALAEVCTVPVYIELICYDHCARPRNFYIYFTLTAYNSMFSCFFLLLYILSTC